MTEECATKYPTRAPANAKALLIVLMTTIFGYFSIKVTADFSDENSAYASSITSNPPTDLVLRARLSISPISTALPVGLFGVVIKVSAGLRDSI